MQAIDTLMPSRPRVAKLDFSNIRMRSDNVVDEGACAPAPFALWDRKKCSSTHIVLDLNILIGVVEDPTNVNTQIQHRPMLADFIAACFQTFASVSLWTSSPPPLLERWLNDFGARRKFLFTFSRTQCSDCLGNYKKPLTRMWETDVAQTVGMTKHNTILVDHNANHVVSSENGNLLLAQPFSFDCSSREKLTELYRRMVAMAIKQWEKFEYELYVP